MLNLIRKLVRLLPRALENKSLTKNPKLTTDHILEQLDQKWSERFSHLEAMLLSKTFNQPDPVFQSVVGNSTKPPPVSAVDTNQPFLSLRLTNRPPVNRNRPNHRPLFMISLHTGLRPITGLDLPTNIFNQPIHQPLTLSSLLCSHWPAKRLLTMSSFLTGLRLITGPVFHLLTSN